MSQRQRLLIVLWVAGGVSVACNILAAEPTAVGRAVAAWPPLALLLVVEVLARSPLPDGRLRPIAITGAAAVASVAGVASFHHMHAVALGVGESTLVAWLFPFSVDGLAVVASVALVGSKPHAPRHPPAEPAASAAPEAESPTQVDDAVPTGVSLFVPQTGALTPLSTNGTGPTTQTNHPIPRR